MKKIILFLMLFTVLPAVPVLPQAISSSDLINNARWHDGKTVVYEGEVVGDIMIRGDYVWINVHDGQASIGVWAHKSLVKDVTTAGAYHTRGDWVKVVGTLNRSCLTHGGDFDIHARNIKILKNGYKTRELLNGKKLLYAGILVITLGIILTAYFTGLKKK